MPDINEWLGTSKPLSTWLNVGRANDTALTIAQQSTSITVYRDGDYLDAQTVRLDILGTPGERVGDNVRAAVVRMLITGYKDHDTISDTDIQRGDRFEYEDQNFEVVQVWPGTVGRLMAVAEATE
jgi:hypothetical protein